MISKILKIFFLWLLFGIICIAQEPKNSNDTARTKLINPNMKPQLSDIPQNDSPSEDGDFKFGYLTSYEFGLSISVLLFGLIIICFEVYLIKTSAINHESTIKVIIVTLIIIGTLFLISAGFNNNKIAPALGLLGTIAGYLLGKASNTDIDNK